MKRFFAVILSFVILLPLSSCGKKTLSPAELYGSSRGFEAEMSVESTNLSFAFSVSRLKPDYFEFIFSEPQILKNFQVVFNSGSVKLKYYGFELPIEKLPIPIGGGIGKIAEVLSAIDNGFENLDLKSSGNDIVYGGEGFTVKFSPDDYLPIYFEISLENGDIYKITVKSFNLINNSSDSES